MSPNEAMRRIDEQLSHVWMVRTFLKHSEEAEEDDELAEVHRTLYDCMLALGPPLQSGDSNAYLAQLKKKLRKLESATQLFLEIQPEISTHMNYQMAASSLATAMRDVKVILTATAKKS